jgi:excisionase family DNA binding protein
MPSEFGEGVVVIDGRVLLTVPEAARSLAIGRTLLYELIAAGRIEVVHIGRCTRVPVEAVYEFVARQRGSR